LRPRPGFLTRRAESPQKRYRRRTNQTGFLRAGKGSLAWPGAGESVPRRRV
jgi:hypothetical protein